MFAHSWIVNPLCHVSEILCSKNLYANAHRIARLDSITYNVAVVFEKSSNALVDYFGIREYAIARYLNNEIRLHFPVGLNYT